MTKNELCEAVEALGFVLPSSLLPVLGSYLDNLVRWNRVMNLMGASTWRRALKELVVDSFYLDVFLRRSELAVADSPQCWDLGSGAGLPGIPLRMLWKRGTYWLVESREKRAIFMRSMLARYPLSGTQVFHGRAEAFMAGRRSADLIISRAFMPWEKLLNFVSSSLAPSGHVILLLNEAINLPQGSPWRESARMVYPVGDSERLFMALRKA